MLSMMPCEKNSSRPTVLTPNSVAAVSACARVSAASSFSPAASAREMRGVVAVAKKLKMKKAGKHSNSHHAIVICIVTHTIVEDGRTNAKSSKGRW